MADFPEKLLLAAPRGYCAGVDRAVQTVERALELYGPPVYVRKEIVHNKHVVEQLRERGAIFVEEETEVPEGDRPRGPRSPPRRRSRRARAAARPRACCARSPCARTRAARTARAPARRSGRPGRRPRSSRAGPPEAASRGSRSCPAQRLASSL